MQPLVKLFIPCTDIIKIGLGGKTQPLVKLYFKLTSHAARKTYSQMMYPFARCKGYKRQYQYVPSCHSWRYNAETYRTTTP